MSGNSMERLRAGVAEQLKHASYDTSDRAIFNTVERPVQLRGHRVELFFHRSLLRFALDGEGSPECRWTFVVLSAMDGYRERAAHELIKRHQGLPYEGDVVTDYFATFAPGMPDCEELQATLAELLTAQSSELSFVPLLTAPLATFEMAAVFVAVRAAGPAN